MANPLVGLAISSFKKMVPAAALKPPINAEVGRYRVRLARSAADIEAACRLRFRVFNVELGEGLESAYQTGIDSDQFDVVCDHLLVEDKTDRRVVGTYRMQSGVKAGRKLGYYSEREFDFSPYEPLRKDILELGRASIERGYRTPEVLTLLWRGIAQYATEKGLRYLVGCSSLNSKEPSLGWQVYRQLDPYKVAPEWETKPTPEFACPDEAAVEGEPAVQIPKLLKTYMAIGARICSAPAWDREFGTIDFLTLMDLKTISRSARNRFLAPLNS